MQLEELTISGASTKFKPLRRRGSRGDPPFATVGYGKLFGTEAAWPLMIYCAKFIKEDAGDADALNDESARGHLRDRLDFFIMKAEDERGLSCPKAWEQVNALLWLFGQESLPHYESFDHAVHMGKELKVTLG